MFKTIKAIDIANERNTVTLNYPSPDPCPSCHTALDPKLISAYYVMRPDFYCRVFITFFCPKCNKAFLGQYSGKLSAVSTNEVQLNALIPDGFLPRNFSQNISELSSSFVSIYNQALNAEATGLDEICGMGYRKALEFLIKDFAIHEHPEKQDDIEQIALGKCIESYIDNSRIKTLAKASAWLGNDETHYIKRHPDYSIEHLKLFIDSVVSFIDSELTVYKAQELLKHKDPK